MIKTSQSVECAKGIVVVVLDTLRADFEFLSQEFGITLRQLPRLRALASVFPNARCGSFPTGPMRTDLLTGRLSFLDAEWAVPSPSEETLVGLCRKRGIWTTLVSDNYVALIPRIGGMLLDHFDTVDFVRGAGCDPWTTPPKGLMESALQLSGKRPSRNPAFEAQYLANARRWLRDGMIPFKRVFEIASDHLLTLMHHDRFLLWIDSFAFHEPWIPLAELAGMNEIPYVPLFPAYTRAERYTPDVLTTLRRYYAMRLGEADSSMAPLVQALEMVLKSGSVALIVLSDHGFLFGEFCFVGKPAETPLPPELYDLVCWLSSHFEPLLIDNEHSLQPHMIHWALRSVLGLDLDINKIPVGSIHLFGRNSPRSHYVAAVSEEILYVLSGSSDTQPELRHIPLASLDRMRTLSHQGQLETDTEIRNRLLSILRMGRSPWITQFLQSA